VSKSVQPRVMITGAGGSIGLATARRFAAQGAKIALFDRKASLISDAVKECRSLGGEVLPIEADQTSREAVETGVDAAISILGGIDILFANAGYGKFSSFLDQSPSDWQRHIDVNLTGTFHVCQSVAKSMVRQGTGGAIVINASSGATQYTNLLSAYCVAKAGLAMLVKAMASELASYDIRVNGLLPGVIETGMTAPMLSDGNDHRDYLLRHTPAGRLGSPEDIAGAVSYLASHDAAFVTGQCLAVDGGQTLLGQPQWFATDYSLPGSTSWEPTR
jgi:NAD(P)-dependent dehydrogenase (short-subunit alcohol dehydrogenase family)